MEPKDETFFDPRWPGEPVKADDLKQQINEMLFRTLPPDVRLGDMETIAVEMHERIEAEWNRYKRGLELGKELEPVR